MGAATMSDEPIKSGEFNRALESLRESQESSHRSLTDAIKSGFAGVEQSFVGIRADIQSFRHFQLDQAALNGKFEEKHQRHRDDLSKSNRIVTEEVDAVKTKQERTHSLALGALITMVLGLIAVLTDLIVHLWKK